MALTPEDCDAMIEAAEASGVVLSVISQRRWYPACQRVKAAIDEGRIGDPIIGVAEVLGWRGPELAFRTTVSRTGPLDWLRDGPRNS